MQGGKCDLLSDERGKERLSARGRPEPSAAGKSDLSSRRRGRRDQANKGSATENVDTEGTASKTGRIDPQRRQERSSEKRKEGAI